MNRYFYTTIVLVIFIAFLGASGAVTPPLNKPADNWQVVEIKGFVDAKDGAIWMPDTELGYWDYEETYWMDFGCDADYERFRKYDGLLVIARCYRTTRGLRANAYRYNSSQIFIDCQEVVK